MPIYFDPSIMSSHGSDEKHSNDPKNDNSTTCPPSEKYWKDRHNYSKPYRKEFRDNYNHYDYDDRAYTHNDKGYGYTNREYGYVSKGYNRDRSYYRSGSHGYKRDSGAYHTPSMNRNPDNNLDTNYVTRSGYIDNSHYSDSYRSSKKGSSFGDTMERYDSEFHNTEWPNKTDIDRSDYRSTRSHQSRNEWRSPRYDSRYGNKEPRCSDNKSEEEKEYGGMDSRTYSRNSADLNYGCNQENAKRKYYPRRTESRNGEYYTKRYERSDGVLSRDHRSPAPSNYADRNHYGKENHLDEDNKPGSSSGFSENISRESLNHPLKSLDDKSRNHPPSNTIKLSGLSEFTTEEDIKEKLEENGIKTVGIKITVPVDNGSGLSRGVSYVRFSSLEESMNCKSALLDESIKGCMVQISYAPTRDCQHN